MAGQETEIVQALVNRLFEVIINARTRESAAASPDNDLELTIHCTPMAATVFGPVQDTFREIAKTIVPEAQALDEASWVEMESIIERGIASRPAKIKRQLRLFVRALDLLPVGRYGKRFRSLDPERRTAFLRSVESSPLVLIRRGFWGLRTFVFMGYYNLETVRDAIGYRAHPDGWEARR